jgi:hypothetical protein
LLRRQSQSCGIQTFYLALENLVAVAFQLSSSFPVVVVCPSLLDAVRPMPAAAGPIHEEQPIGLQRFVVTEQVDRVVGQISGQVVTRFGRLRRRHHGVLRTGCARTEKPRSPRSANHWSRIPSASPRMGPPSSKMRSSSNTSPWCGNGCSSRPLRRYDDGHGTHLATKGRSKTRPRIVDRTITMFGEFSRSRGGVTLRVGGFLQSAAGDARRWLGICRKFATPGSFGPPSRR